jgi:hypothetical protein
MSSFARFLMSLLFCFAFAAAKDACNFNVSSEDYKQGELLQPNRLIYLQASSNFFTSVKPVFPLEQNKMYLRHKIGGNAYSWFAGQPSPEKMNEMHAFDLKENRLSVYEASLLRFYANPHFFSYQDEADIYFDKRYLYSARVGELYFFRNCRWQQLKAVELPGAVTMDAPAGTAFTVNSTSLGYAPMTLSPVNPGLFFVTASLPGYLPVTSGVQVRSGKVASLKALLVPLDTVPYEIKTAVTFEAIVNAKSLEETEKLYDTFIADVTASPLESNSAQFESTYPAMKKPPMGMSDRDPMYLSYAAEFEATHARAKSQWREMKMRDILALNDALRKKLEEQEKETLRGILRPVSVSQVPGSGDALLKFEGLNRRYDVSWSGKISDTTAFAAICAQAMNPDSVQVFVTFQNKPVWLMDKYIVASRHHYRYMRLEFSFHGKLYEGIGKFILPDYILREPEVQAWLNPPPPEPVKTEVPAVAASVKKDTIPYVDPVIRYFRGDVAEIDSGSFRYKGKVVSMSPFALNVTEVTQAQYHRIIGIDSATFKNEKKPVHNVTWFQAKTYCEAVGGTLPTEAQWEYAARVGGNGGYVWDEKMLAPEECAVFEKNSEDLGKKSPMYGPHEAGSLKPNSWGLFDMAGNVAEWTLDSHSALSFYVEASNPSGSVLGYSRVYKGGSWRDDKDDLDLTDSEDEDPRYWSDYIGFRCAFPAHQKVDLPAAVRYLKMRGIALPPDSKAVAADSLTAVNPAQNAKK